MEPRDLQITEDGHVRRVVRVERAPAPSRLAIVVNDHGLGLAEVREGLNQVLRDAPASTSIGLFSADRPEWTVTDFTTDRSRLAAAVATLTASTTVAADFDGLMSNLARRLRRDAVERTTVLTVTVDEPSRQVGVLAPSGDLLSNGDQARTSTGLRAEDTAQYQYRSGNGDRGTAPQFANPVTLGHVRRSGATFFGISARHSRPGDHEGLLEAAAEATGGLVTTVTIDPQVAGMIARTMNDMLNQTAITYESASAPADGLRLRVKTNRPGVTIRAPERVY